MKNPIILYDMLCVEKLNIWGYHKMRRKILLLSSVLLMVVIMAGCSEDPKEELEVYQKDIKNNVVKPVMEAGMELTEKLGEFSDGEITDKDIVLSLAEEYQKLIDEKKEYVADMNEPETEVGQEYYEALVDGMKAVFDMKEESVERAFIMAEGTIRELTELDASKLYTDYKDKQDVIRDLESKYEEEYGAEFEMGSTL